MARTEITRYTYGSTPLRNITAWTDGDPVNGLQYKVTGREILLVRNKTATAKTITTITTGRDPQGRTGAISAITVPGNTGNNGIMMLPPMPSPLEYWSTEGNVLIDVPDANCEFAVLQFVGG